MVAQVEIKGLDEILKHFDLVVDDIFNEQLNREIGNFIVARIQQRTSQGKDVEGRRFKPYSAAYALFRELSGRPTNVVDLFFTGSMMSSMTFETTDEVVRVYFQPTTDPSGMSNPAKAFFLHQEREFFALSEDDISQIFNIFNNHLDKLIQGR